MRAKEKWDKEKLQAAIKRRKKIEKAEKRFRKQEALLEEQRVEDEARKKALAEKRRLKKEVREVERKERNFLLFRTRFPKLLHRARRRNKALKVPDPKKRRFENRDTVGQRRAVRIDTELHEGTLEEILFKLRTATASMPIRKKLFPLWSAQFAFSSFGERHVGRSPEAISLDQITGLDFQDLGFDTTGVFLTSEGMLLKAEDLLHEFLGVEYRATIVWLNWIVVRNYRNKR